jgi:hypothetical protein
MAVGPVLFPSFAAAASAWSATQAYRLDILGGMARIPHD